jgi:hypothetical protein
LLLFGHRSQTRDFSEIPPFSFLPSSCITFFPPSVGISDNKLPYFYSAQNLAFPSLTMMDQAAINQTRNLYNSSNTEPVLSERQVGVLLPTVETPTLPQASHKRKGKKSYPLLTYHNAVKLQLISR